MSTQTEQITKGKGLLRQQIKELEGELEAMRKAPLKTENERLAKENAALRQRVEAVEEQATRIVESALALARLVNQPLNNGL